MHVGLPMLLPVLAVLAACQPGNLDLPTLEQKRPPVNPPPKPEELALKRTLSEKYVGEKVGNGPFRIALLVPKSASGAAGRVGSELARAARTAVRDTGANRIQLIIKDTKGQAAGAAQAARQAKAEGASLILGPLFSANVAAASAVANSANIPMITFSSDESRAKSGVYLLSFATREDVQRTLNYGISSGANRIIALLPSSAYGTLVERQMRRTADASGGQVVSVVRYARDRNAMVTAARSVALSLSGATGVYIPEGGEVPSLMLNELRKGGVSLNGKQILGSSQWESGIRRSDSVLQGAIYAAADRSKFATYARRYSATYGTRPTVTSGLGYDAVSLASELVRRNALAPFTKTAIESPAGFRGATGTFRFLKSGHLQRGLAVYEIKGKSAVVVSPAPSTFGVESN